MNGLILLISINAFFILGYFVFMLLGKNSVRHYELTGKDDSKLIKMSLRNYWFTLTEPCVQLLIRMRITPNMITLFGLAISITAGIFFGLQSWGLAGWIMISGGVFDLFDGRVARATKTVSKRGAYLDAVTDRYSDGAILGGLTFAFYDHWLLFFIILSYIGFYSVSYTKARAEAYGVTCNVGFFQRPERIFSLGMCAIFSPILSYYFNIEQPVLIYAAVIVLGIGTLITSIYRISYTFKRL